MMSEAIYVLEPGAVVADRYRVARCIKSGGMGVVYEVSDIVTKRRLAMKTLRPGTVPSASRRARFEQEASITSSIDSEHIVKVEDAGFDARSQVAFLTMELLVGRDLDAVLAEEGPLDSRRVVRLLSQVGLALASVHGAGIVHRDIKPENLFLTRRDSGEELVKILDFGVAKLIDGDPKATAFVGTPLYMPPEQIRGEHPDPRADTYTLAQVAFALLTGHAYLEPGNVRESATRRATRYDIDLPCAFDGWFERATADDVALRFAAADELVAELARVLGVDVPVPRAREGTVLVVPAVTSGVPTAPPSVETSLAGSFHGDDSMDGVSSSRSGVVVRWKRYGGTALASLVGAVLALGVTRWRAESLAMRAEPRPGVASSAPPPALLVHPIVAARSALEPALAGDGGAQSAQVRASAHRDPSQGRHVNRTRFPDDELLSRH